MRKIYYYYFIFLVISGVGPTNAQDCTWTHAEAMFGPGRNLPVKPEWVYCFKGMKGQKWRFTFEAKGWFENAVCIYGTEFGHWMEKGNYGYRTTAPEIVTLEKDVTIYITGWHKKGPPSASRPWNQSPFKKLSSANSPDHHMIGFEDSQPPEAPDAFGDAVVTADLIQ